MPVPGYPAASLQLFRIEFLDYKFCNTFSVFKIDSMSLVSQVSLDRSSACPQCVRNLSGFEAPLPQFSGAQRRGLGRSLLSPLVDPVPARHFDPGHLPLLPIFEFNLGEAQHYRSDHANNSPGEINSLRNANDTNILAAPIG